LEAETEVEREIEAEDEKCIDTVLHELDQIDMIILGVPRCEFPSTYLVHRVRVGLS
jgi:hypothetical protein